MFAVGETRIGIPLPSLRGHLLDDDCVSGSISS